MHADREADVWAAFSEHFLDTDARDEIPRAALRCLDAGLSVERARDIWRYEVTPAIWPNAWSMAGEWAGWDRPWLKARIAAKRGRWPNRPGRLASLVYRLRGLPVHATWLAIEDCMKVLEATSPDARKAMVEDLGWLAKHYFERHGDSLGDRDARHMRELYTQTFLPTFARLTFSSDARQTREACNARVEAALAVATTTGYRSAAPPG